MESAVESRSHSSVEAEALFASDLQSSTNPTDAQIEAAVDEALRRFGLQGCVDWLAQEYGDHPVEAVARMAWALAALARAGADGLR